MHQAGEVAAQPGHFLDDRRRQIDVFLAGHEEDGLHALVQVAVHERHLQLELEVRHGTEPRITAWAPRWRTKSTRRPLNGSTSTRAISLVARRTSSTRSSRASTGCFCGFAATAT